MKKTTLSAVLAVVLSTVGLGVWSVSGSLRAEPPASEATPPQGVEPRPVPDAPVVVASEHGQGLASNCWDASGTPSHSSELRGFETHVEGGLPEEVVRRVLRARRGALRSCYRDATRVLPALQVRVSLHLAIGRDGSVTSVQDAGSDIPSSGVVLCVIREFYGLSFPRPEAGTATVLHTLEFSPPR